jgi:hypothetical protein
VEAAKLEEYIAEGYRATQQFVADHPFAESDPALDEERS